MSDTALAIRIDEHTAIRLLREVVAEQGATTVYRIPEQHGTCVYVDNGGCSCLIAHVLDRAGVPMADLEPHNDAVINEVHIEGLEITDPACAVLGAAQHAQDVGEAWGEAERVGEEVYSAIQRGEDAWAAAEQAAGASR